MLFPSPSINLENNPSNLVSSKMISKITIDSNILSPLIRDLSEDGSQSTQLKDKKYSLSPNPHKGSFSPPDSITRNLRKALTGIAMWTSTIDTQWVRYSGFLLFFNGLPSSVWLFLLFAELASLWRTFQSFFKLYSFMFIYHRHFYQPPLKLQYQDCNRWRT